MPGQRRRAGGTRSTMCSVEHGVMCTMCGGGAGAHVVRTAGLPRAPLVVVCLTRRPRRSLNSRPRENKKKKERKKKKKKKKKKKTGRKKGRKERGGTVTTDVGDRV